MFKVFWAPVAAMVIKSLPNRLMIEQRNRMRCSSWMSPRSHSWLGFVRLGNLGRLSDWIHIANQCITSTWCSSFFSQSQGERKRILMQFSASRTYRRWHDRRNIQGCTYASSPWSAHAVAGCTLLNASTVSIINDIRDRPVATFAYDQYSNWFPSKADGQK
jgi:hypothetical protein